MDELSKDMVMTFYNFLNENFIFHPDGRIFRFNSKLGFFIYDQEMKYIKSIITGDIHKILTFGNIFINNENRMIIFDHEHNEILIYYEGQEFRLLKKYTFRISRLWPHNNIIIERKRNRIYFNLDDQIFIGSLDKMDFQDKVIIDSINNRFIKSMAIDEDKDMLYMFVDSEIFIFRIEDENLIMFENKNLNIEDHYRHMLICNDKKFLFYGINHVCIMNNKFEIIRKVQIKEWNVKKIIQNPKNNNFIITYTDKQHVHHFKIIPQF